MPETIKLTNQQLSEIVENCPKWVATKYMFARSLTEIYSHHKSIRVFDTRKTRWWSQQNLNGISERVASELDRKLNTTKTVERTVVVNWIHHEIPKSLKESPHEYEWVIPYGNDWSVYPLPLLGLKDDIMSPTLLKECVDYSVDGLTEAMETATENLLTGFTTTETIPIGLVGVKRFVTVRTVVNFESLVDQIDKYLLSSLIGTE